MDTQISTDQDGNLVEVTSKPFDLEKTLQDLVDAQRSVAAYQAIADGIIAKLQSAQNVPTISKDDLNKINSAIPVTEVNIQPSPLQK